MEEINLIPDRKCQSLAIGFDDTLSVWNSSSRCQDTCPVQSIVGFNRLLRNLKNMTLTHIWREIGGYQQLPSYSHVLNWEQRTDDLCHSNKDMRSSHISSSRSHFKQTDAPLARYALWVPQALDWPTSLIEFWNGYIWLDGCQCLLIISETFNDKRSDLRFNIPLMHCMSYSIFDRKTLNRNWALTPHGSQWNPCPSGPFLTICDRCSSGDSGDISPELLEATQMARRVGVRVPVCTQQVPSQWRSQMTWSLHPRPSVCHSSSGCFRRSSVFDDCAVMPQNPSLSWHETYVLCQSHWPRRPDGEMHSSGWTWTASWWCLHSWLAEASTWWLLSRSEVQLPECAGKTTPSMALWAACLSEPPLNLIVLRLEGDDPLGEREFLGGKMFTWNAGNANIFDICRSFIAKVCNSVVFCLFTKAQSVVSKTMSIICLWRIAFPETSKYQWASQHNTPKIITAFSHRGAVRQRIMAISGSCSPSMDLVINSQL